MKNSEVIITKKEVGGAAVEYIIVTTFATVLAIASVTFVANAIKTKMGQIEKKLDVSFNENLDIFE